MDTTITAVTSISSGTRPPLGAPLPLADLGRIMLADLGFDYCLRYYGRTDAYGVGLRARAFKDIRSDGVW